MPLVSSPPRAGLLACFVAALTWQGVACTDGPKVSEERATRWVVEVARKATADVQDLERGLPAGTAMLAPLYAHGAEASDDMAGLRAGLRRVRGEVPEMRRSDSTFLALTDANGVAIRNDLEQDVMAGQNLWTVFPDLRKTRAGGLAFATGHFGGSRPSSEPDLDWVAAAPVKNDRGAFDGMLVAGWSMRRLAYHLQEYLRQGLVNEQEKTKTAENLPVAYVLVFDKTGVYAAPTTPAVSVKAVVDLDLLGKTAAGPAHGVVSIAERSYGFAAQRVTAIEPDGGVVVLWSGV